MVGDQDTGLRLRDILLIAVICVVFVVVLLAIIAGIIWLVSLVLLAATDGQTWAHWVIGSVAAVIGLSLLIGFALYSGE